MKAIPFKKSREVSIGVELEFQIVNQQTHGLTARAKDLIRSIQNDDFKRLIHPEITQSMIEINSSIHQSPQDLLTEFKAIKSYMLEQAAQLQIRICGGGTHPFQRWSNQKIFPTTRFKNLSRQYRYLMKRSTVFGQHIHIGCKSSEDALYLTHALARYVPHLMAMSASSPFYQHVDTGFHSARSNVFSVFPLSGVVPYLKDWREFSQYYYKMRHLGIVSSMKDFYWDIRPKPEFGTVEVRVCDTPLTITKAVTTAAYLQTLALYLLTERPITLSHDLYNLYSYNRFQAIRYGFDGVIIDSEQLNHVSIADDIKNTIQKIAGYSADLKNDGFMAMILSDINENQNDATRIRNIFKAVATLPKVVKEQCDIWERE